MQADQGAPRPRGGHAAARKCPGKAATRVFIRRHFCCQRINNTGTLQRANTPVATEPISKLPNDE